MTTVEPPTEPEFLATHAQCREFAACPCGCGLGWCAQIGEHVDGDGEVIVNLECDAFSPGPSFEQDRAARAHGDWMRDVAEGR